MVDVNSTATGGRVCTLLKGMEQCEAIPCRFWMTKCVILKYEASEDVAKGICHNVNLDLIDSNNQPLGNDHIAIQIVESLLEHNVSSN